jgi:hypothetical protein
MTGENELIERLKHLISLDEPRNGGPYQGLAAKLCLGAMTEAAKALTTQADRIQELEARAEKAEQERDYLDGSIKALQTFYTDEMKRLREVLERAADDFDAIFCLPPVTETNSTVTQFDVALSMADRAALKVRTGLKGEQ